MDIRVAVPSDDEAVTQVIEAAFPAEEDRVAALWREVQDTGLSRISLVAVDGGDVVGHVGVSHAWLDARRQLVDVLLLSPLSVHPRRQGQRIGTALLASAVEAASRTGRPALVLEGSPHYYGARGFRKASSLGIVAPSDRTPAPAFQVVVFEAWEAWMTGRVVYPDVWWRHDAAGLRDPVLAELEQRFQAL